MPDPSFTVFTSALLIFLPTIQLFFCLYIVPPNCLLLFHTSHSFVVKSASKAGYWIFERSLEPGAWSLDFLRSVSFDEENNQPEICTPLSPEFL